MNIARFSVNDTVFFKCFSKLRVKPFSVKKGKKLGSINFVIKQHTKI